MTWMSQGIKGEISGQAVMCSVTYDTKTPKRLLTPLGYC